MVKLKVIAYTLADGRKVKITFKAEGNKTEVTEVFEAESTNSVEMQRSGWQAFLKMKKFDLVTLEKARLGYEN